MLGKGARYAENANVIFRKIKKQLRAKRVVKKYSFLYLGPKQSPSGWHHLKPEPVLPGFPPRK